MGLLPSSFGFRWLGRSSSTSAGQASCKRPSCQPTRSIVDESWAATAALPLSLALALFSSPLPSSPPHPSAALPYESPPPSVEF